MRWAAKQNIDFLVLMSCILQWLLSCSSAIKAWLLGVHFPFLFTLPFAILPCTVSSDPCATSFYSIQSGLDGCFLLVWQLNLGIRALDEVTPSLNSLESLEIIFGLVQRACAVWKSSRIQELSLWLQLFLGLVTQKSPNIPGWFFFFFFRKPADWNRLWLKDGTVRPQQL